MPAMTDRLVGHVTPLCPPKHPGDRGVPLGSPGCPDPFVEAGGWWTVAGIIAAAVVAAALVMRALLRSNADQPPLVPQRLPLAVAGVLLAGGTLLAGWPDVFAIPVVPAASAITVAGFLLAGTSLRPRGSWSRGLALGAVTYVALGVAVSVLATAIVHRLAWTPFLPLLLLFWPDVLAASLGGYYVLS